jgi:hypothetical protein
MEVIGAAHTSGLRSCGQAPDQARVARGPRARRQPTPSRWLHEDGQKSRLARVPLPELHLHRDLVIRASWLKAGIVELPVMVAEAPRLRTSHDPAHGADPPADAPHPQAGHPSRHEPSNPLRERALAAPLPRARARPRHAAQHGHGSRQCSVRDRRQRLRERRHAGQNGRDVVTVSSQEGPPGRRRVRGSAALYLSTVRAATS